MEAVEQSPRRTADRESAAQAGDLQSEAGQTDRAAGYHEQQQEKPFEQAVRRERRSTVSAAD